LRNVLNTRESVRQLVFDFATRPHSLEQKKRAKQIPTYFSSKYVQWSWVSTLSLKIASPHLLNAHVDDQGFLRTY